MTQDKNRKSLNVPPLRFPGFTEEWKRVKVSDLLDFYSTNSLSWEMLNYEGGDILNLHYGLIHSGLPTLIDLKKDILPFINETAKPKKFTLCKDGDVAFADASEDTNDVAKAVEFINLDGHKAICGLHTIHGRDNGNKTVLGFKGYAFASSAFHNQIRRVAQGTKIYSISSKIFDEVFIGIPNKEEQTKIARLLHIIDERITVQNKIIEDLKKLKSAIYDKVFKSIKGVKLPLENVADIIKGKQLNGEFLMESGSYYVMNGGIEPSGYYHTFNISSNTISISEGGNSCGYIQWNDTPFWSGGHCYTLNIKDTSIEDKYLYHFLKWREADIMKLRIGTGLPNIQKKDLARFTIEIPTSSLQTKIICLLDFYNAKIENETYVLELYNRQKLYLLSQMFI